jgi:hypothetical protein
MNCMNLKWLSREIVDFSSGSGMHFIHDHMPQLLVVNRAHKNVGFQRFASLAAHEQVLSVVVESIIEHRLRHLFGRIAAERRAVVEFSRERTCFRADAFHQLADCHSRRVSVRIHDHVWTHSDLVERHVFLRHDQARYTFLSVTRRELVSFTNMLRSGNYSKIKPSSGLRVWR